MAVALLAGVLLAAAVLVGRWPPESVRRRGSPGACGAASRDQAPRHPRAPVPVGVAADLVVAALQAGLPAEAALEVLRVRLGEAGLAEPDDLSAVTEALDLATRTGVAPAALVRAAAGERRRQQASAQAVAARRLGVLVLLPTGLCLLPAFVVLTVVPLVLGLLQG